MPTNSPPSPTFKTWPGLPRNVWVLTLTSFLTDISSEMLINLIPLFLANVLGVRIGIIGLIEGLAETTASLLKIFSGWLSDRLGQRKWLTVAGYSLSTLAKPFLYFATSWSGVLAVRFTDRVGKGIRTAPRDALIADSIQPLQRGLAFGLHRAGDTAGATLGLLVALGVIWAIQGHSLLLHRSTFQWVVLARTSGQVWLLFALYGLYYGLAEGTGKAMVADLVQPDRRGAAYGVYNAAVGLTVFPASLIAGILWQGVGPWPGFGPAAPFLFGAALALAAVTLLLGWLPKGDGLT